MFGPQKPARSVRRSPAVLGFLLVPALGCTTLPDIPADVCGNGVVEDGEACDSFAKDPPGTTTPAFEGDDRTIETHCGEPGTLSACKYVWSETPPQEGARWVCPVGYVAGVSGDCVLPEGVFERPKTETNLFGSIAFGRDFDGDGVDDLFLTSNLTSQASISYFDAGGGTRDSTFVSLYSFPPTIANLTSEGPTTDDPTARPRTDLVIPTLTGTRMVTGESDRTAAAVTFTTYGLPPDTGTIPVQAATFARLVGLAEPLSTTTLLLLASQDIPAWYVSDNTGVAVNTFNPTQSDAGQPVLVDSWTAGTLQQVVRVNIDPTLVSDPAFPFDITVDELAFVYSDDQQRTHISVGTPDMTADVADTPVAQQIYVGQTKGRVVAMETAPFGQSALIVSLANDVACRAAVITNAGPFEMVRPSQNPGQKCVPLVAAYDADGDVVPDTVVDEDGVYLRLNGCDLNTTNCWVPATLANLLSLGTVWKDAHFLSARQVVAIPQGRPGLDTIQLDPYTGLGAATRIATAQPLSDLQVGDLDGDLVNDVVAVSRPTPLPSCDSSDDLLVFWGSILGKPEDPVIAASVPTKRILVAPFYDVSNFDSVADLGVVTLPCKGEPYEPAGIFFGSPSRELESRLITTSGIQVSAAMGQFSGDDALDLVTLNVSLETDSNVTRGYAEGTGETTFSPAAETVLFPVDADHAALALGALTTGRLLTLQVDDKDSVFLFYTVLDGALLGTVKAHAGIARFDESGIGDLLAAGQHTIDFESLDVTGGDIARILSDSSSKALVYDADLDGIDDIVGGIAGSPQLNRVDGQLTFFKHDGQGSFTASDIVVAQDDPIVAFDSAISIVGPGSPVTIAAATANQVYLCDVQSKCTAVAFDDADATPFRAKNRIRGLASGDFNGDGAGDLAVITNLDVEVLYQETHPAPESSEAP